MSESVSVEYGGHSFDPAPNVTIQRETFRKTDNSEIIGGLYRITLAGTNIRGGAEGLGDDSDLQKALVRDWELFRITDCAGKPVVQGRGIVDSVSKSSDNFWSITDTYDIEIVIPGNYMSGVAGYLGSGLNLESASTSYNHSYISKPIRFGSEQTDAVVQIDRSISAKGLTVGSGQESTDPAVINTGANPTGQAAAGGVVYISGFYHALDYVTGVLGPDGASIKIPEMTNIVLELPSDIEPFLTERTIDANPDEATLTVNDTFLCFPTGLGSSRPTGHAATDSFTLACDFALDNGNGTIALQGDVKGYPVYTQGASGTPGGGLLKPLASKTAFESASGYFTAAIDQGIFGTRAAQLYSTQLASNISGKAGISLNTGAPTAVSYNYNIEEGSVSDNLTYDNRPANCHTGVLSEVINVTRNQGVPVVASHTVLGRAAGPIFQDIGTKTASSWDLSIEATILPPVGCVAATAFTYVPNYNAVVTGVEGQFTSNYQYHRTADNETFDPKTGRYTRQVSWAYSECN